MKLIIVALAVFTFSLSSCSKPAYPWSPAFATLPSADRYCVVSFVAESDPYFAAVKELERLHDAKVLITDPDSLDRLLSDLKKVDPAYVAFVIKPETLELNLIQQVMKLATKIDDDPFLDFQYGFITGDSPETALSLIKAGQLSDPMVTPEISMIGVGELAKSQSFPQRLPLSRGYLTQTAHMIANGKNGERDNEFIESAMPKLENKPILIFAGHGYPQEVVGGPTYEHLKDRDFHGAVALNIACYTGVTGTWYEDDWQTMKVKQHKVPAEESFCLSMLKTGVAGYVAYSCARPSGPTMLGDSMLVATSGMSLGELRRRDGNSVVLAHLQQGFDSLQVKTMTADTPLASDRKTQDFLLAMSTGGVLFGDPACTPFAAKKDSDPRVTKITENGDTLAARVNISGPLWHFFCSDQIVMWDEQTPSFKIESTIPLGNRYPKDVRLKDSSFGDVPHRLVAVIEQHNNERRLHVKATFKQPAMSELTKMSRSGVFGTFEVTLSDVPNSDLVMRRGDRERWKESQGSSRCRAFCTRCLEIDTASVIPIDDVSLASEPKRIELCPQIRYPFVMVTVLQTRSESF